MSITVIRAEERCFSVFSEGDEEFGPLMLMSTGKGRQSSDGNNAEYGTTLLKATCHPVSDNDPSISSQCHPVWKFMAGVWPGRIGRPPC
jgi:hypothetical protein